MQSLLCLPTSTKRRERPEYDPEFDYEESSPHVEPNIEPEPGFENPYLDLDYVPPSIEEADDTDSDDDENEFVEGTDDNNFNNDGDGLVEKPGDVFNGTAGDQDDDMEDVPGESFGFIVGAPTTIHCDDGTEVTCASGTQFCYDNSTEYCLPSNTLSKSTI